jgi:hypothetical protein
MQLADTLVAQAKTSAELAVAGRRIAIKAIVGGNDLLQAPRQMGHHAPEGLLEGGGFGKHGRIGAKGIGGQQANGGPALLAGVVFDGSPNVTHNGWPSVGGEGQTPVRIVAQDRSPQADAACLQGFHEGKVAEELLADHSLHQAIVATHEVVKARVAPGLRLLEQGDLGGRAEIPHPTTVNGQGTPPI